MFVYARVRRATHKKGAVHWSVYVHRYPYVQMFTCVYLNKYIYLHICKWICIEIHKNTMIYMDPGLHTTQIHMHWSTNSLGKWRFLDDFTSGASLGHEEIQHIDRAALAQQAVLEASWWRRSQNCLLVGWWCWWLAWPSQKCYLINHPSQIVGKIKTVPNHQPAIQFAWGDHLSPSLHCWWLQRVASTPCGLGRNLGSLVIQPSSLITRWFSPSTWVVHGQRLQLSRQTAANPNRPRRLPFTLELTTSRKEKRLRSDLKRKSLSAHSNVSNRKELKLLLGRNCFFAPVRTLCKI